jgi:hypothetical protein
LDFADFLFGFPGFLFGFSIRPFPWSWLGIKQDNSIKEVNRKLVQIGLAQLKAEQTSPN